VLPYVPRTPRRTSPERAPVLSGVAVAPDAQRMGVGSALVRWGCARADADGLPAFVAASRIAAPMYARHGFVVKDVSAEVYPDTGLEVEQTRMLREPQTRG
jgi:predicted N-acetyltransferase YhbS